MDDTIIQFQDVRLGYGKQVVLEGLNIEVHKGDFLGIIGPNGAGKTTVLRAVLRLISPMAGQISVACGLHYGYVMQRQFLDTQFPFTVEKIVCMGRFGRRRPWTRMDAEDHESVASALKTTGLTDLRNSLYRELSGGQRQRTLIARALASKPDVLVLDEPTNDMDVKGETQIMNLLQDIRARLGVTIILVSHLLHVVLNYTEKLILLVDGKAHSHLLEDLLGDDLLSRIYGLPIRIGQAEGKKYLLMG